jgi:hypothetical protein
MDILSERTSLWILGLILVLNGIDLIATLYWVLGNWATEANPIMGFTLTVSPMAFAVTKVFLVSAGVFILLNTPRSKIKDIVILGLAGLYSLTVAYHLTACLHILLTST